MSCSLLLPDHRDDITLYSIVSLIARLNGHENSRTTSQLLFDSPVAGLRHDFPSDLAHFCQVTKRCYGDVSTVANRYTSLGYFLRFRDSPSNVEAVGLMSSNNVARLKFILGLPASPIGALLPLRHCSECALIDQAENGFAYWRREHQLPSSLVCAKHGVPLLQSRIRSDGTGWSSLHLPLDLHDHGVPPILLADRPSSLLSQLARLGSCALSNEIVTSNSEAFRYAYLHGLKQNGLLTPTGRVRAIEFIDRIEKAYRPIADLPPFDHIVRPGAIDGLLKLVRKPRSPANPISHLLLINFLFGSWELFNTVLSWEEQIGEPLLSAAPEHSKTTQTPPCPPSHLEERLLAISGRLSTGRISLTKACHEEGVDIGTAMRWLGKVGFLDIPRRPKTVTAKLRAEAILLLNQGLPLVHIGKQLGLSKATIDRISNESPERLRLWKSANWEWKRKKYRQAFLETTRASPDISRKELQKLKGSGFSWLYRHDRKWLSENLPAHKPVATRKPVKRHPRVNWEARDTECCRAIKALGQNLQLESWERKKPPAILRRLPKLSFSPRLDRLPQSRAVVATILNQIRR